MSFIVNHNGKYSQKNLGAKAALPATRLDTADPSPSPSPGCAEVLP